LGAGLLFLGLSYYISPLILKQHFERCDDVRQILKQEASQLGQDKRLKQITEQEKSLSRMPMYSKLMMATGVGIIVVTVLARIVR